MGGAMALHLAAHYQIDGVVALAPGLHLRNKFAYLSGLLSPFFWYSWKKSGPDIKAQVKTHTYNIIPLKAINQLLLFLKHLENDLGDVYSPTLIIYASNDHVIHPESSREIYQKISSPSKRILELRESYHIITLDVEKEIAIQEVVKFIKDL